MKDYIGPRGVEILNTLVRGWAENDAKMPGNMSYQEVFDWLASVGADQPTELIALLESMEQMSHDYQRRNSGNSLPSC